MSNLSPIQMFAALAAESGDVRQAFQKSGLRAMLDVPFEGVHTQCYHNGSQTFEKLSTSDVPLQAGFSHACDRVFFEYPFTKNPDVSYELARLGQPSDKGNFAYYMYCRTQRAEPSVGGLEPEIILGVRELHTPDGPRLDFVVSGGNGAEFSKVLTGLSLTGRIVRNEARPALHLLSNHPV